MAHCVEKSTPLSSAVVVSLARHSHCWETHGPKPGSRSLLPIAPRRTASGSYERVNVMVVQSPDPVPRTFAELPLIRPW